VDESGTTETDPYGQLLRNEKSDEADSWLTHSELWGDIHGKSRKKSEDLVTADYRFRDQAYRSNYSRDEYTESVGGISYYGNNDDNGTVRRFPVRMEKCLNES